MLNKIKLIRKYKTGGLYTVKANDSLWKIAQNTLGDGTRYRELMVLNNLNPDSVIHPGDILITSKDVPNYNNTYTVQKGDTLSNIANRYNISISDLQLANRISDINKISVGQQLNIPQIADTSLPRKLTGLQKFSTIKDFEAKINKKSNLDIINWYHSNNKTDQYYLVDDKANGKLSVYKDGKLVRSYRAAHGANKESDDMTITYVDSKGSIKSGQGNMSTPAGIYYTDPTIPYHNSPAFMRRTKQMKDSNNPNGIPSSIHVGNTSNLFASNGCTRLSKTDLQDLAKYVKGTTVTYILPYNKQNKFFIRNGELQFKSSDIRKTPSYNTIVSKPIRRVTYDRTGFSEDQQNIIRQFSQGLISNKKSLQNDLGINNDTYNELYGYAMGILGTESNYGDESNGISNFFKAASKKLGFGTGGPDYKSEYSTYGQDADNNSIGLTQIRFSQLSKEERDLFKKYRITKRDLVYNPQKAAIATMIKLAHSYKNTGHNYNKIIRLWNNNNSYLNRVIRGKNRFTIYE